MNASRLLPQPSHTRTSVIDRGSCGKRIAVSVGSPLTRPIYVDVASRKYATTACSAVFSTGLPTASGQADPHAIGRPPQALPRPRCFEVRITHSHGVG